MARLAFFGTPEFSLPSLRAVHRYCVNFGHDLVVVVSQKDQPTGRGLHFAPPPVKTSALALDVPVLQPETLKKGTASGDHFFEQFLAYEIDLAIVVAYGKLIPERLLFVPTHGFVNVHASLLPRFRGAAPVQRAIENGDRETGVCLMAMVKRLDEGDIFVCERSPILPFDTTSTLLRRLAHLGAHALYDNLFGLLRGTLQKMPQSEEGVVYAPLVAKEEGALNFSEPVKKIAQKVKAFDPWPGAFAFVHKKRVKFFDSFAITDPTAKSDIASGTVVVAGSFLGVKGPDGIVYFQAMQVEGKKILPIKDALLGFPIHVGDTIAHAP
ncbi:MAG TPA: methionyl-tRNA formyltransferase [Myxococcota bacterium]|nr:methionyl-tRNA formyltransferase [Myxococcota bacterium]